MHDTECVTHVKTVYQIGKLSNKTKLFWAAMDLFSKKNCFEQLRLLWLQTTEIKNRISVNHWLLMINAIICHVSKYRMLWSSAIAGAAKGELMSPEGTQNVKTGCWPPELRRISKEWLQGAQTLASSHTQKSTKFLNLGYLVFFN